MGDADQGGAVTAAQADAEWEVDRGGANDATQPDVEVGAGRGDTDSAARPVAGEGETGGGAQERPASQIGVETLVLEPPRAGVEGVAEEESALGAPVKGETHVPESAGARDDGVVTAVMAQAAPENVALVVQLPESSEDYGDSRDIDPAAAASAADRFAEFVSASEEMLSAGTSEGPRHEAIIQSGVPLEFLCNEQEEEAVWKAQIEVGSQIMDHLDRALELHRTTDFQISNVSAFPWELLVFGFVFVCFTHALPLAAAEGHFVQKRAPS